VFQLVELTIAAFIYNAQIDVRSASMYVKWTRISKPDTRTTTPNTKTTRTTSTTTTTMMLTMVLVVVVVVMVV
jgi:hypothetical protein